MFKNPRVLLLGSTGMLGHQLCNYLINYSDYTLFDIARTSKFRKETALIDVRNERKHDWRNSGGLQAASGNWSA